MKRHRSSAELAERLIRCRSESIAWRGVAYRFASVKYANQDDLLMGEGARRFGARWNPPDRMATIYASLQMETALQEMLAHHRYYGFPIKTALPRVLVSIEVRLAGILNLTDRKIRRMAGVTQQRLLGEDWRAQNRKQREALAQAIGRLAWERGWEGLLVPSAANRGGVNLVIFRDKLVGPEGRLKIVNADELPPSVWRTMQICMQKNLRFRRV